MVSSSLLSAFCKDGEDEVALKAVPGSTESAPAVADAVLAAAASSSTARFEPFSLMAGACDENWDGSWVCALVGDASGTGTGIADDAGVGAGADTGAGVGVGVGVGVEAAAGAGAGGGVGDDRKIHGVMEKRTAFHTASPASR